MDQTSATEVADALRNGRLGGRVVEEVEIHGTDDVALAVDCGPGEVFEAWSAAREAVDTTRRWPVVVTWEFEPERYLFPDDVGDVDARMRTGLGAWQQIAEWRDEQEAFLEILDLHGPVPSATVVADLGPAPTDVQVERWLLDNGHAKAWSSEPRSDWYVPSGPCSVLLLPTPSPARAILWLSYFGALDTRAELAGVLASWHDRFGAELVASWGTMLQLHVARPPQDVETAWELAGELLLVGGSLQQPRSSFALTLVGRTSWFLHDRP